MLQHKSTFTCISFFKAKNHTLLHFSITNPDFLTPYQTRINYQCMMDQVEVNRTIMREDMDVMKGKMDQLLEAMMALARKEDNP